MDSLMRIYVKCVIQLRPAKGHTMTEYPLILAAIAIVVFVTYEVLGQDINQLATWGVDNGSAGRRKLKRSLLEATFNVGGKARSVERSFLHRDSR